MRTQWKYLERTAWIVGGLLVAFYALAQLSIGRATSAALEDFRETRAVAPGNVGGRILRFASPDTAAWARTRVTSYDSAIQSGAIALAVLRIPALELEAPIYIGVSEWNLNRGVALIDGTARLGEGNTGLAAHRDGYFRALQRIHRGDRIEVHTITGRLHYRVTDIRIVAPDAVEVLDPTEHAALTLVTCYPFYQVGPSPRRFIVRAERISAGPSAAHASYERS